MDSASFLAASNLYKEPRPPRRGSHRPSASAAYPARSLSPAHDLFVATSIPDDSALAPAKPPTSVEQSVHAALERIRRMNGRSKDFSLEEAIYESFLAAPRTAACHSSQKQCKLADCTKISVSRGLCRGHGGGRRCQAPGCTKSAQSRSDRCWAHGGGQRCEVEQCMRSRKSKRFCAAHMSLEAAHGPFRETLSPVAHHRLLPSLSHVLRFTTVAPRELQQ
ncbi:hypothetical protein ATCC90586_000237 [Pythium insidiosum]|nr:hypothetical protein ATCC90586_000237 [Pythium insidiosum]